MKSRKSWIKRKELRNRERNMKIFGMDDFCKCVDPKCCLNSKKERVKIDKVVRDKYLNIRIF